MFYSSLRIDALFLLISKVSSWFRKVEIITEKER